jgi:hypothetical protein
MAMLSPPLVHSPDEALVRIDLDAVCHTCRHRHRLGRTPQGFTQELWEWEAKHREHAFEVLSPRRTLPRRFRDRFFERLGWAPWWCTYAENANLKIAYAASAALTCTLASLASSTTFVAGREATAIVNTTNLYVDYRITAKITTGTTATVDKEIRVYAYAVLNDTPLYPDTITGSDAAVTITSTYVLDSGFVLMGSTSNSATSNVGYYPKLLTLAEAFGHCPTRWGLYLTHNTVAALHATGGNHVLTQIGCYFTAI